MLLQKRKKLIIFFSVSLLIISAIVLFFPKTISEHKILAQKTKVFVDLSKKEAVSEFLGQKSLDFEFVDSEENADVALAKNEMKKLETIDSFQEYYIPVSSFLNQIENLDSKKIEKIFKKELTSWRELGGDNLEIKVLILDNSETKSGILEFFQVQDFEKESNLDALISKVSRDEKYLSFLPLEKINAQVNSLSVNNISPIKSEDFSSYPYKISYFLQSKKQKSKEQTEIIESIREYFSDYNQEAVELTAAGDIMLSRHVGTKIREAQDNSLPFRKLHPLLSSADIAFANLESPFFDKGSPVTQGMVFKAESETIEGLKLAGIDLVSLANNHFGNQRREGMLYTFDHLKNNNISYFGAGGNLTEAHNPAIIEKKGSKFAFLSYNEISPENYKATDNLAGIAWISDKEEDLRKMESDIREAKEKSNFVVVSFHWGNEYQAKPISRQTKIAQRAIEAGADIILSQHPHVVQAVDFINNKFVAYSLGNFVFDQMWSEETREGLVAKVYFGRKKILDIDLIPIKIDNFNQPRLATKEESTKILNRVFSASELND